MIFRDKKMQKQIEHIVTLVVAMARMQGLSPRELFRQIQEEELNSKYIVEMLHGKEVTDEHATNK